MLQQFATQSCYNFATRPETGYGYIAADEGRGLRPVARFVEKPDRADAEWMIAAGGHYWNAGIFLWQAGRLLDEIAAHAPEIHQAAVDAIARASAEPGLVRAAAEPFARAPSISVDYAVMEKTTRAAVVPVSMGWSDVGNWSSLHEIAAGSSVANHVDVGSLALDCGGCYIRSTGPKVVAVGVQDLVVVITDDVALILPRADAQRVKEAAAAFASAA